MQQIDITLPDSYDGPVKATVVRSDAENPTKRAIIYIPGYIDYFFQLHMAERLNSFNFNFYAVDPRRTGRSLLEGNHPHYVRDLREYFPEITEAVKLAIEAGNERITLLGHSTGGLIGSLYCAEGELKDKVNNLVLNSPFFEFNKGWVKRLILIPTVSYISRYAPYAHSSNGLTPLYFDSISKRHYGEWEFNTEWKPREGIPLYFAWLKAIREGHKAVKAGLGLHIPVLVMHSETSSRPNKWGNLATRTDIVLNVKDIKRLSPNLGTNVTIEAFPGALHDLTLSKKPVREKVLRRMMEWINFVDETFTDDYDY